MDFLDIKAGPLALLLIAISLVAFLIPVEPTSVGMMTPFHRTFQGFYGNDLRH